MKTYLRLLPLVARLSIGCTPGDNSPIEPERSLSLSATNPTVTALPKKGNLE
ncbi:hypothetical protein [Fibrella aquatilis]|uniref:Uncharacterized protein n=1 Tax=Fibrella aquatilis TaxID=2817059 RepID=A0A939K110_9BACT|nr:hypothetical protein [Fibrella aquatilis]MBO0933023.1 hypothetical protein [Fibrella aquatilis]